MKKFSEFHQTVKEIKEILLDPEDGLIVRVNKNTYWRRQIDLNDINELKTFKYWQEYFNLWKNHPYKINNPI